MLCKLLLLLFVEINSPKESSFAGVNKECTCVHEHQGLRRESTPVHSTCLTMFLWNEREKEEGFFKEVCNVELIVASTEGNNLSSFWEDITVSEMDSYQPQQRLARR